MRTKKPVSGDTGKGRGKVWLKGSGLIEDGDATFGGIPFDKAVAEGEEGVIATDANIVARVEASAALADEDGAGLDGLSIVAFDAEAFAVAIATVLTGSLTFFVCHSELRIWVKEIRRKWIRCG